jgi:hypothetical protein
MLVGPDGSAPLLPRRLKDGPGRDRGHLASAVKGLRRSRRPVRGAARSRLSAQQVTDGTTVHDWKDVVSHGPHEYRLVGNNVGQSDREGLGRVVVGERSDDRIGFGFPDRPFLLYAANCIGSFDEEKTGLTRHGVTDDFGIEVVPSI